MNLKDLYNNEEIADLAVQCLEQLMADYTKLPARIQELSHEDFMQLAHHPKILAEVADNYDYADDTGVVASYLSYQTVLTVLDFVLKRREAIEKM